MVSAETFLQLRRQFLLRRQQPDIGAVRGSRGAYLRAQQQATGNPGELLECRRVPHFDANEFESGCLGPLRSERFDGREEHEVAVELRELGLQRVAPTRALFRCVEVLAD